MSDQCSGQASSSQRGSSAGAWSAGSFSPWARPPRVEIPSPPPEDDGHHPLLEEPTPPTYSQSVLRRTFLTYAHLRNCGTMRTVADYYTRLEALEETMSPEAREASRRCDEKLSKVTPPISKFFEEHFGHMYRPPEENATAVAAGRAAAEACKDPAVAAALNAVIVAPPRPRRPRTPHSATM